MILQNGKRIDGCSDTVPVGTLQPYLGLVPPKGYLVCQGQLVSKITYSKLYEICGDTFGTSTETHFYLPDLRGKTLAGYDENDTTMNTIGKLLGQKTHTHTSAAHTHTIAGHVHSTGNHTLTVAEMPSHTHAVQTVTEVSSGAYAGRYMTGKTSADPNLVSNPPANTGGGGAHNHGNTGSTALTSDSTTPGATGSNTNYQPTITVNWIVKAVMLIPDYIIVEDTLNSDSAVDALSARQGKLLNEKFTDYATKSEMIQYLPLSGGTLNDMLTSPYNNLLQYENEFNFIPANNTKTNLYFNYKGGDKERKNTIAQVVDYYFCDGQGTHNTVTLHAKAFDGLATKATGDGDGNNIVNTYLKKSSLATYVVEQGTNNGWRYRKWSDGVTEAWAIITKSLTVNQPEGTLFYDSCSIDIPSGLFSTVPVANITVHRSGGYGAYYTIGSISKTVCQGWVFSDLSSGAANHYLNVQLMGQYN